MGISIPEGDLAHAGEPNTLTDTGHSMTAGARLLPRWPLYVIAAPAAIAVWSGWVGLGTLCGFGVIHPLPGIWDTVRLNTSITLPIGVEAYGSYALAAWISSHTADRARRFARWSAIGSLALGMVGQVAYHLLSAAHAARAPWPVVVLVSCLPVVTLGFGAALAHLLHDTVANDVPEAIADEAVSIPVLDDDAETLPAGTPDGVSIPAAPEAGRAVSPGRARHRAADATRKAERRYARHLAEGTLPSLRSVMRDLGLGQVRAREVRAHLASMVTANGAVPNE
jgi:hypothetical protein